MPEVLQQLWVGALLLLLLGVLRCCCCHCYTAVAHLAWDTQGTSDIQSSTYSTHKLPS
jgi:hypothetical protein